MSTRKYLRSALKLAGVSAFLTAAGIVGYERLTAADKKQIETALADKKIVDAMIRDIERRGQVYGRSTLLNVTQLTESLEVTKALLLMQHGLRQTQALRDTAASIQRNILRHIPITVSTPTETSEEQQGGSQRPDASLLSTVTAAFMGFLAIPAGSPAKPPQPHQTNTTAANTTVFHQPHQTNTTAANTTVFHQPHQTNTTSSANPSPSINESFGLYGNDAYSNRNPAFVSTQRWDNSHMQWLIRQINKHIQVILPLHIERFMHTPEEIEMHKRALTQLRKVIKGYALEENETNRIVNGTTAVLYAFLKEGVIIESSLEQLKEAFLREADDLEKAYGQIPYEKDQPYKALKNIFVLANKFHAHLFQAILNIKKSDSSKPQFDENIKRLESETIRLLKESKSIIGTTDEQDVKVYLKDYAAGVRLIMKRDSSRAFRRSRRRR